MRHELEVAVLGSLRSPEKANVVGVRPRSEVHDIVYVNPYVRSLLEYNPNRSPEGADDGIGGLRRSVSDETPNWNEDDCKTALSPVEKLRPDVGPGWRPAAPNDWDETRWSKGAQLACC